MKKRVVGIFGLVVLVALLVAGCASFDPARTPTFQRLTGDLPYWVYVPKAWTPDRAWPVVVYLHGAGERGSNPADATQRGLGPEVYRSNGEFPAVVLFPQAPSGSFWGMPGPTERALRALDEVMARYHGDPSRVYLTGSSLGGYGTWFMGALYPERFAALVPICGGVRGKAPSPDAPFAGIPEDHRADEIARRIGKTPTWIFHGKKDWLVPVAYSRELYAAIKRAGGDVRYTEYPDLGHDSWDRAYADPELWKWLFAQHRTPITAPAPSAPPSF
jgi:predicted peptidase